MKSINSIQFKNKIPLEIESKFNKDKKKTTKSKVKYIYYFKIDHENLIKNE